MCGIGNVYWQGYELKIISLYFSEHHTDQKVKNIFEADIQLTSSDKEGVDTTNSNSKDTAEVDVGSVVSKRKAIFSRRNLWVTKEVPVELGVSASKISWNVFIPGGGGEVSKIYERRSSVKQHYPQQKKPRQRRWPFALNLGILKDPQYLENVPFEALKFLAFV